MTWARIVKEGYCSDVKWLKYKHANTPCSHCHFQNWNDNDKPSTCKIKALIRRISNRRNRAVLSNESQTIKFINMRLVDAKTYGLISEVIRCALHSAGAKTEERKRECLNDACYEWDV